MIYILFFILAFCAGFSARKVSLCLVRATHELIERKPPKTMTFVIEAMAVALWITIPAMIFFPDKVSSASSYDFSAYLFFGAILYGVGAAINSACAIGTLNQLMNGKIEYIFTILGIAAGFMMFLNLDLIYTIHTLKNISEKNFNILFLIPLMIPIWIFVAFQLRRFVKQSQETRSKKWKQYLTAPIARDFIGVFIFGFCSGALYLLMGRAWDYTKFIMDIEEHIYAGFAPDHSIFPVLITTIALFIGMGVATILSKTFTFQKGVIKSYIIRFFAGSLMGVSAGLIPGGNDTIILYGLPGLAIHAPIALIVMMMSITMFFFIQKWFKKYFI